MRILWFTGNVCAGLFRAGRKLPAKQEGQRADKHRGESHSCGIEGERLDILHSGPLEHESSSPDHSREKEKKVADQFSVFRFFQRFGSVG